MGDAATAIVPPRHTIDGKDLCWVHVEPSGFLVEAEVTVLKDGQRWKKTASYVRLNNKTAEITDEAEKKKYIAQRWGVGEGLCLHSCSLARYSGASRTSGVSTKGEVARVLSAAQEGALGAY